MREKLIDLPIDDAILILKEEHRQRTDGYTTYLAHGGKGDPAEEVNLDALAMAISALEQAKWISVKERLPEEHESTWAKFYGTKSWVPGMFRKWSNTVIACVERMDGRKRVIALHTIDGKWDWHEMQGDEQVTHWMPLPDPPKGE